jgi:excisionase family DNA binding protein
LKYVQALLCAATTCPILYFASRRRDEFNLRNNNLDECSWWHWHCSKKPSELFMSEPLNGLRLLTLPEAAALLHVSTRTLQRMIRRKDLPAFKVGGQWRVRESQLTRWIEGREDRSQMTAGREPEE